MWFSTGVSIETVIKWISGNRVLTYAQGIRLENQQFGEEHGLGLNLNGQESVEIIKRTQLLYYMVRMRWVVFCVQS